MRQSSKRILHCSLAGAVAQSCELARIEHQIKIIDRAAPQRWQHATTKKFIIEYDQITYNIAKTAHIQTCLKHVSVALLVLCNLSAEANSQAIIQIVKQGPLTEIPLRLPALTPKPVFEVPPVLLPGGNTIFVPTGYTYSCQEDRPQSRPDEYYNFSNCSRVIGPAAGPLSASYGQLTYADWRRNYAAIMGALSITEDKYYKNYYLFVHGENKNEKINNFDLQNTVNPSIDVKSCFSGYTGGSYKDCWASYNGFIGAVQAKKRDNSSNPIDALTDCGPIVWPSRGYVDNLGRNVSHGVRHPSVFRVGGDIYLFYLDTSFGDQEGRVSGIKVARIKFTSSLRCPTAVPLYQGNFSEDNLSLPTGFRSDKAADFYALTGGKADPLWSDSHYSVRFSVAKIANFKGFLGVEEYFGRNSRSTIRLRYSSDLQKWSDPIITSESERPGWQSGSLHYPIFADAQGRPVSEIDASDFAILGSGSGNKLYYQVFGLKLIPPK